MTIELHVMKHKLSVSQNVLQLKIYNYLRRQEYQCKNEFYPKIVLEVTWYESFSRTNSLSFLFISDRRFSLFTRIPLRIRPFLSHEAQIFSKRTHRDWSFGVCSLRIRKCGVCVSFVDDQKQKPCGSAWPCIR